MVDMQGRRAGSSCWLMDEAVCAALCGVLAPDVGVTPGLAGTANCALLRMTFN